MKLGVYDLQSRIKDLKNKGHKESATNLIIAEGRGLITSSLLCMSKKIKMKTLEYPNSNFFYISS
jgi:CRISPR/Cas system endoribonuclease Cas6 (RAMP superfamily)